MKLHFKSILLCLFLFLVLIISVSCEKLAVQSTPAKKPLLSNSMLSRQAQQTFWTTLHQGNYNNLDETIRLLTAAYLENPHDPNLAAFLGFSHIWKVSERQRNSQIDPRIVNHAILSRQYFADAVQLAPQDPRFLGFYGDATLVEGKIFDDERMQVKGYFILKRAINAWPEFNYFTAGYPLSSLPADSKSFKKGLAWQWKTLDLCAGQTVDRNNPDFSPYMKREIKTGMQRACWNSWIAPHNFEGFFLNMGDMLVKSGDWQTAIKIYNNAKLSKTYDIWPYRVILEERIDLAQSNVAKFNQNVALTQMPPTPTVMFNSRFSCSACHQREPSVSS